MTKHPINFVQNSLTHINPATSAHYFPQITTKEHINTESFLYNQRNATLDPDYIVDKNLKNPRRHASPAIRESLVKNSY